MTTRKAIVIASGENEQIQSGDYVSADSLGSGSTGGGLLVLLDNNTFATPPSGNLVYSNTSVPGGNTIANTVAETTFSLPAYSFPANSLVAGSVIRIKLWGVYSTAALAPTINVKLKLNGTTYLATGVITSIALVSNGGWFADVQLIIFSVGVGGTIDAQAYGEFSTAATTGLSVNVANTGTQSIDTTISQPLTITITWGTASASNTITLRNIAIYLENLSTQANIGTFITQAHCMRVSHTSLNPADATSYFFGINTLLATTTTTNVARRGVVFKTGKFYGASIWIYVNGTLGTTETATIKFNNITASTTVTMGASFQYNNVTQGYSIILNTPLAVTAADVFEFQVDMPTFATNPTTVVHIIDTYFSN